MHVRIITSLMLGTMVLAPPAHAQQCTVPNTLTNGQIADATEVMDNFTAVATCVEDTRDDAVTHEGTPSAGEIAVFDSATGITGGDLTGDVTTSGGTETALSETGVTPGSYVNPNLTIDAKGRVTAASTGSGGSGGSGLLSARVRLNGTQSLSANTYTVARFDTVEFEGLTGLWSGAPDYAFVVPAGVNRAEVVASSGVTSVDRGGYWNILIRKNGTYIAEEAKSNDFYGVGVVSSGVFEVVESDEIQFVVRTASSKTIGNTSRKPNMSIKLWYE